MYKVIVVDDEPSASRHISMIIEKYCSDFQVVAIAENGQDAIEKIREYPCEIVITDVCMPLMDGLELIEWIDGQNLTIKTLVTSGYQEFDYVQKAINLGACSYLLKPVIPSKMKEMLGKIKEDLDKDFMHNQIQIFNALYNCESYDKELIENVFPNKRYYLAVKRKFGLPTRYNKSNSHEAFAEKNKSFIVYGRDIYEELFFIPPELLAGKGVTEFVRNESNLKDEKGYQTLVFFEQPIEVDDFFTRDKEIYRALDSAIIIGKDQSLTVKKARKLIKNHIETSHNDDLDKLYYFIKEKQDSKIKSELDALFKKWENDRRTQLYIEALVKQILYRIRESYGHKISFLETEYLIEEIFTYSVDLKELQENYWEILKKFVQSDSLVDKIDTPQFLDQITQYLYLHIDEQIPLKELCEKFGVSQPYLSKMFRKYVNESYNRYITRIRIERAKDLMMQNSDIRIKDVAAMVGYDDQFYFSRIFRSYMEVTPSEFINQVKNHNGMG